MKDTIRYTLLKDTWRLSSGFWRSEEKWTALALLAVSIGMQFIQTYAAVLMTEWQNTFYTSLQNADERAFWSALGYYVVLFSGLLVMLVYKQYSQQLLELKWRRWLTGHFLGNWVRDRKYYLMQVADRRIDNPDQRISEDVRQLIGLTLSLSMGALNVVVTLCTFIPMLWGVSGALTLGEMSIPGYLVWVAILYSLGGTWLTSKLGNPLVRLNFALQRREADFRYSMMRFRENGESIAFYGGDDWEKMQLKERFSKVFTATKDVLLQQKKLAWFTLGFSQIQSVFPLLVISPRVFTGAMNIGGLMQATSVFGQVESGLSYFLYAYTSLAEWQATVNRLTGFMENLERVEDIVQNSEIRVSYSNMDSLAVEKLEVRLPDGKVLLSKLALNLQAGDALLITGGSGCGKSTLMRALAGLWPFGEGTVQMPVKDKDSMMFLPQKNYMPQGILRETLSYPSPIGTYSDEQLKKVLLLCGLSELTDRLEETADWMQTLSLGEQQRIAFCRVFLKQPKWLFLDEATSALDEPNEAVMYTLLKERLPDTVVISVGHRSTLLEHHTSKLRIEPTGRWKLAV